MRVRAVVENAQGSLQRSLTIDECKGEKECAFAKRVWKMSAASVSVDCLYHIRAVSVFEYLYLCGKCRHEKGTAADACGCDG